MTYKVELDIYNGPMDLLLYLIRRDEVDIKDVSLARIADQYLAYLDVLKALDIELAGDFVVMAATLLELKSRSLLPRPPEEVDEAAPVDEEDPRETLIRQLIEYRRFKEVAAMLDDRGREMARRFPRQFDGAMLKPLEEEFDESPPPDFLQGVEVWDLIGAFSVCLRTLGYSKPREVIYDDLPVEDAGRELLARLEAERSVLFTQLFAGGRSLAYCITVFLAVLELIRQRRIGAEQETDFRDLRLFLRDPSQEPPPAPRTPHGAEEVRDALERKHPRRPSARQVDGLREMIDEVDLEKTEFDEILDSVRIPDVEAFHPLHGVSGLTGRPTVDAAAPSTAPDEGADAAAPPAADAPDAQTSDGAAGDKTPPPEAAASGPSA